MSAGLFADRRQRTLPRSTAVLLGALLVQLTIVSDIRLFGAVGDMLLLVTIAAGLVDGPDRGATYGFAAGILYDLVLDTPFGLSALTYALVGYGVGLVASVFERPSTAWQAGITAAASGVAMGLYTALAHLVGTPYPVGTLPRIAVVVAAWNVVLVLPVRALVRWAVGRRDIPRLHLAFR